MGQLLRTRLSFDVAEYENTSEPKNKRVTGFATLQDLLAKNTVQLLQAVQAQRPVMGIGVRRIGAIQWKARHEAGLHRSITVRSDAAASVLRVSVL